MWTSNSEWVNDNIGEMEDEGAECIGVPGRKFDRSAPVFYIDVFAEEMIVRDVRWSPDGRGVLLADNNTYCCAFEVDDDGQT